MYNVCKSQHLNICKVLATYMKKNRMLDLQIISNLFPFHFLLSITKLQMDLVNI